MIKTILLVLLVILLFWFFVTSGAKVSDKDQQKMIQGKSILDEDEGTYARV